MRFTAEASSETGQSAGKAKQRWTTIAMPLPEADAELLKGTPFPFMVVGKIGAVKINNYDRMVVEGKQIFSLDTAVRFSTDQPAVADAEPAQAEEAQAEDEEDIPF